MVAKVTINERGALTIPVAVRQALGIRANDELIVEETPHGILLRPSISVPVELYTEARICEFAEDDDAIGALLGPAQ
jgi:AbrB family looped-hinge helix DNA binding protein